MTTRVREWVARELTFTNLVVCIVSLIGVGGYMQSFRAMELRLLTIETQHRADMELIAATYQRKDVQGEAWLYVREQLQDIKGQIDVLRREAKAHDRP